MFSSAHASNGDWMQAVFSCLENLTPNPQANLGFIYLTESLCGDLPRILDTLKSETGVNDWVGSVGLGVCALGHEYFDEPAIAVMTAALPEDSFEIYPSANGSSNHRVKEGGFSEEEEAAWNEGLPFVLAHADTANPEVLGLIEDIAATTDGYVVGGLTSSSAKNHHVAGDITGGGISGVIFSPQVGIVTSVSQGCSPIGKMHTVTQSADNIIVEIDGRRALDMLLEEVDVDISDDLNRLAGFINVALPVPGTDTGDYVVRNIIGVDEDRGIVAIAAPVDDGDPLMFVSRDEKAAEEDLVKMLERVKGMANGQAKGGIYISCIARGPHMFGQQNKEMELVRDIIGDLPLVGMYANGEISNARLYSYTSVLTLFT